jgi:hypothetical protein
MVTWRPRSGSVPIVRPIPIFISSPGDVLEERQRARRSSSACEGPRVPQHLKLDLTLWDDPEAPAPMLANLSPQEPRPRPPVRVRHLITICWGQIGTPLAKPLKKDKTRYLRVPSGSSRTLAARRGRAYCTGAPDVPIDTGEPKLKDRVGAEQVSQSVLRPIARLAPPAQRGLL